MQVLEEWRVIPDLIDHKPETPFPALPAWLEINDIEELEFNLVGLTAVVLSVNFLSVVLEQQDDNLALYGISICFPGTGVLTGQLADRPFP